MLIHLQLCSALPNRSFPAFDDLIRQVKQSAANESDMSRLLGAIIKEMVDEAVDPYLMAGLLIEDAVSAHTAGTAARHNSRACAFAYQSVDGA
jgi:hypothetical protein